MWTYFIIVWCLKLVYGLYNESLAPVSIYTSCHSFFEVNISTDKFHSNCFYALKWFFLCFLRAAVVVVAVFTLQTAMHYVKWKNSYAISTIFWYIKNLCVDMTLHSILIASMQIIKYRLRCLKMCVICRIVGRWKTKIYF